MTLVTGKLVTIDFWGVMVEANLPLRLSVTPGRLGAKVYVMTFIVTGFLLFCGVRMALPFSAAIQESRPPLHPLPQIIFE